MRKNKGISGVRARMASKKYIDIIRVGGEVMKVNENFVMREIAGESILVPVGAQTNITDGVITLNPVAAVIWRALNEQLEYEAVLEAVMDEFEIEGQQAREDFDEFLTQMQEAGLLK